MLKFPLGIRTNPTSHSHSWDNLGLSFPVTTLQLINLHSLWSGFWDFRPFHWVSNPCSRYLIQTCLFLLGWKFLRAIWMKQKGKKKNPKSIKPQINIPKYSRGQLGLIRIVPRQPSQKQSEQGLLAGAVELPKSLGIYCIPAVESHPCRTQGPKIPDIFLR